MPAASRWMIRLSLLYLLAGMVMGALLLLQKAWQLHPAVWMLLPLHIEVTITGWIIQLTMGTAYWMLPRYLEGPPRAAPGWSALMVVFLNAGIICILADALWQPALPLRAAGRALQVISVGMFVLLHWGRAVSYRHKTS